MSNIVFNLAGALLNLMSIIWMLLRWPFVAFRAKSEMVKSDQELVELAISHMRLVSLLSITGDLPESESKAYENVYSAMSHLYHIAGVVVASSEASRENKVLAMSQLREHLHIVHRLINRQLEIVSN
jgi:hypothetical protein